MKHYHLEQRFPGIPTRLTKEIVSHDHKSGNKKHSHTKWLGYGKTRGSVR